MCGNLLQRAKASFEEGGVSGFAHSSRLWAQNGLVKALQPSNDGVYVMDEDWDNLIIVDACPVDVFRAAYDGDREVQTKVSRGETTARYFRENFEGGTHYDTIVVCGNAAVGDVVDDLEFFKFVGLWGREEFPDFDRRFRDVVFPERVLEKTVEMHEEYPDKRIIAHFLQPHPPFVLKDGERLEKGSKYRDFTAARKGEVDPETIVDIYEENTEYVLEYATDLADRIDGKSVITSDHGTLLGENLPLVYQLLHPRWKFRNRNRFSYAHYNHVRIPTLVEVPWVELDYDTRREIRSADAAEGIDMNRDVIEEQLEALGYRT